MRPLFDVYITRSFLTKILQKSEDDTVIDFQKQFLGKFTNAQFFVEGFSDGHEFDNFLFVHGLSTNEGFSTTRLVNFTERISDDFFFDDGSAYKLFLLEDDGYGKCEDRFGYLFITCDEIPNKWLPHRSDMEKEYVVDDEPPLSAFESNQFKAWSQLLDPYRSGHSFVIFDKYILSDRSSYELNIESLLKAIGQTCSAEAIQILIFTEAIAKRKFRELSEEDIGKLEDELCSMLEQSGIKNARITCVLYPRAGQYPGLYQKEHDRYLFSNYFFLESGAGFVLFKNRRAFCHRTTIRVNSLLNRKKSGGVYSAIRSISQYVSSVRKVAARNNPRDVVFSARTIEHPLIVEV